MKWLLLLALSLASFSQAAVKSSYALKVGPTTDSALYWQHRSIKNKNVFVIGYQNTNGLRAEQVIPKEEFNNNVQEFKEWRKKLVLKPSPLTGLGCVQKVMIIEDQGVLPVCLQGNKEKTGFMRWYQKQKGVVAGRL